MSAERENAGYEDALRSNKHDEASVQDYETIIKELRARVDFLEKELRSGRDRGASPDTKNRQADEDTWKKMEILRHVIDSSPVPMVLYNERKNYYFYNKKFTETFGYTARDVPTIDEWWPLAYPDEKYREAVKKRWVEVVEEALRKKASSPPQEVRIRCKDGSVKDVLNSFSSIGEIHLSILYDITERKQTEEALRESEERFRQLVDSSPISLALYDEADNVIYLNRMYIKTFGYTLEDISTVEKWWPQAYPDPAYRREVMKQWREREEKAERESKDFEPMEVRVTCKDGTVRHIQVFMARIGKQKIVVFGDITERKRAEEALKDAKQQAELYLDLMGHDINNMHQIIQGYLEIARDMLPPGDARGEFIAKPLEVLDRSARLIQNVRKLQMFREGMFQCQRVELTRVLAEVKSEFGSIPHKAINLDLHECRECYVQANELLHDVFANLVSNAIKHTGDRADITINLEVVEIDGCQYCRVSVEDNGPGIPDDLKPRIFNRLLKGEKKAKGMGLGLYLVKSLVDSYEGRVTVEDRVPGDHMKGAKFVVILPGAGSPIA